MYVIFNWWYEGSSWCILNCFNVKIIAQLKKRERYDLLRYGLNPQDAWFEV